MIVVYDGAKQVTIHPSVEVISAPELAELAGCDEDEEMSPCVEIDLSTIFPKTAKGMIFATEPLTDEKWTRLDRGELMVLKKGEVVYTSPNSELNTSRSFFTMRRVRQVVTQLGAETPLDAAHSEAREPARFATQFLPHL